MLGLIFYMVDPVRSSFDLRDSKVVRLQAKILFNLNHFR